MTAIYDSRREAHAALPDAKSGEVVAWARAHVPCGRVLQVVLLDPNPHICEQIPSLLTAALDHHRATCTRCGYSSVAILRH